MKLIEKYVHAVTRQLPETQRDDVARELRASIEDILEDKGSRKESTVREVLISLGDPDALARQYTGSKQYLIGPQYYALYIRMLKLVLTYTLPVAFIVHIILKIIDSSGLSAAVITSVIGGTIVAGVHAFFWVTLIVVLLERLDVKSDDVMKNMAMKEWNPDNLPDAPHAHQIPVTDITADYLWYGFIALLPIISQHFIGAHTNGTFTPFINPDIWASCALLVAAFGLLGIAKTFLKQWRRIWTFDVAFINSLYSLAMGAALLYVFTTVNIVNPAFIGVVSADSHSTNLAAHIDRGLDISAFFCIVTLAWDAIKGWALYLKGKTRT